MPVYMVGYDLYPSHGDHDYDELYMALEEIGIGYWDCLDSTWLIITEKTPTQLRDELKQHLKDGDRRLSCAAERELHGTGSRTFARLGLKIAFGRRRQRAAFAAMSPEVAVKEAKPSRCGQVRHTSI